MSRSLNKVLLIGNVGSEPEVRTTPSGTKVAKLSLATNRTFNDRSGQQQEKTEWHRLTFWDRLAELVERYLHKGDRLFVEGRLEYSQTEDEKGGTRYWTDIVVREMVMLGGAGAGAGGGGERETGGGGERETGGGGWKSAAQPTGGSGSRSPFREEDDDLPF